MATILILEGNTPDMVAKGQAASGGFVQSFAALAPEAGVKILNPYACAFSAKELEGVTGVVFTGAGVAWSTDAAEAAPLRRWMEGVLKAGLPVWGSCNGMQLAAVVLGGAVGASPNGFEVGVAREVQLTEAGAAHAMLAGRRNGFAVPCIHRDEVQRLPKGAELLAGNAHSPVQVFAYEQGGARVWATQYHPELAAAGIAAYLRSKGIFSLHQALAEDLEQAETCEDSAARLGTSRQALSLQARSTELANWLQMLRQD